MPSAISGLARRLQNSWGVSPAHKPTLWDHPHWKNDFKMACVLFKETVEVGCDSEVSVSHGWTR